MKNFLFLPVAIGLFGSCQSSEIADQSEVALSKSTSFSARDIRSEDEPMLYDKAMASVDFGKLTASERTVLAERMRHSMATLATLHPFPIPTEGNPLPVTLQEAHQGYVATMEKIKNEPIVSLYQQRFARIMLREYGLLGGNDDELTSFYVNQLIEGHSLDFGLMTDALVKLTDKGIGSESQTLLRKVTQAAEERAILEKRAVQKLTKMADRQDQQSARTGAKENAWFKGMKIGLEKLKTSGIDRQLDRLHEIAKQAE